jgi:hypothetical protein
VASFDHARVAPGVSRFEVVRSFVGEPHRVTIWPAELRPFALRFHFHEMQDDDTGEQLLWLVQREQFAPPVGDGPVDERVDWTSRHQRTMNDNAFRYRRYAEQLLQLKLDEAGHVRLGMLTVSADAVSERRSPEQLDDLELLSLVHEVEERLRMPHTDLERIAAELGISRSKLWRYRGEAKRRGLA